MEEKAKGVISLEVSVARISRREMKRKKRRAANEAGKGDAFKPRRR